MCQQKILSDPCLVTKPGYALLLSPEELHAKLELLSSSPRSKSSRRKDNVLRYLSIADILAELVFSLVPVQIFPVQCTLALDRHTAFVNVILSQQEQELQKQCEPHFSPKLKHRE